jgi:hypothetical protein
MPLAQDAPRVATIRTFRPRAGALLALVLAACVDTTTPRAPSHPISEADIDAVNAVAADLEVTMAQQTVVSLLGVRVPFNALTSGPARGSGHAPRGAQLQLASDRPVLRFLGDAPVNPTYWGATFVRAGAVFQRDTARRDAPSNAVRVLLYERVGGAANANVVGWVDLADSVRGTTGRVTHATVSTATQSSVVTVRGSVKVVPGALGASLYDVLAGTIGAGTRPIVVSDSFVVDSTTDGDGRNVITTTIPQANAQIRVVTPTAPGVSFTQSRMLVTVGGRTVRVEESHVGGITFLSFYDGSTELGQTNSAFLPNLGDGARTRYGGVPTDVVRRWMNAVGRLLRTTPVAADLAQATGNLVTLLDPAIP